MQMETSRPDVSVPSIWASHDELSKMSEHVFADAAIRESMNARRVPEVLFLCVHNAGRSQMAAGLLKHHAAGWVRVRSAGSAPADKIYTTDVYEMAVRGI